MATPRKLHPKFLEVIRYNVLYGFYASRLLLGHECFKGKSVLLAGPARTLGADLSGYDPNEFDVIVKMNNGLGIPLPFETGATLRCDVLFHSLTEDIPKVTNDALSKAGVRCLIHRATGKGRFPITLKASRELGSDNRIVRFISPDRYRALSQKLNGASPTTGLVALDFLLNSDAKRVVIAGFTFFQTKYVESYDDRDKRDEDSYSRVKLIGHHDPDNERTLAVQLIGEARREDKIVVLGEAVADALYGREMDNQ